MIKQLQLEGQNRNLLPEPFILLDKTKNKLLKQFQLENQIIKILREPFLLRDQTTDKEVEQLQFKGKDRNLLTEQFLIIGKKQFVQTISIGISKHEPTVRTNSIS